MVGLNRRKECGSDDSVKDGVFGAMMKVDIANDGPGNGVFNAAVYVEICTM